ARRSILLLDDILSALDARTEQLVVDRLLSSNGMLRRMGITVALITHSGSLYFSELTLQYPDCNPI
ncbi:MAG: hypothetical protein ACRYGR_06990, partial [Janthinobacterium lividum]